MRLAGHRALRLRTGCAAVPGLRIHPVADLGDEAVGGAFRQALDRQRIDAAAAFDADGVPDQSALMGDFGEVGHRQMLVLACPWREPGADLDQRDAEVGRAERWLGNTNSVKRSLHIAHSRLV